MSKAKENGREFLNDVRCVLDQMGKEPCDYKKTKESILIMTDQVLLDLDEMDKEELKGE